MSESQVLGPVAVLIDFNSLLGLWRRNQRICKGVLLQDLFDRCEVSAVSLGSLASGPTYTYCSGDVRTTVDYILMYVESASMTTCVIYEMLDLNTSDHLSRTVFLVYLTVPMQDASENQNAIPSNAV